MGTAITDKGLYAALNNCAFVSTDLLAPSAVCDPAQPFAFLMDAAMLGVGVGFDTKGATSIHVRRTAHLRCQPGPCVIPDSREGWVESLRMLLDVYLCTPGSSVTNPGVDYNTTVPSFDYSEIRPAGTPIKGMCKSRLRGH